MKDKQDQRPNTYVATVRVNLTTLASIGLMLENNSINMQTLGRLASEGLRVLGSMTQNKYPVETCIQAVIDLRRMGYNDPMERGTRYYNALHNELEREINEMNGAR